MSNTVVQTQVYEVRQFLSNTVKELATYLNYHSIQELMNEDGSTDHHYYEELLSELRRIEVYCKEALDVVDVILKSKPFRKTAAEKTLYRIYHKCVLEFFFPKEEVWYENSRALYTGNHSISFHTDPPVSIKNLILTLEKSFQQIREELDFYESDEQQWM